jgi:3-oxoacyl-[acyl-carrier-protein] synthase II
VTAASRVAVTGVGLVSGLGVGTGETWKGLLDGVSAAAPITDFDAGRLSGQRGVHVPNFTPGDFATKRVLRSMAYCDQLALAAASLAMRDAGAEPGAGLRDGLFVGGSKEISNPSHLLAASLEARRADGSVDVRRFGEIAPASAYPLFYVEGLQAASLFYISQAFGLRGTNTYYDGSAEASAQAVASGYRAVRDGYADRVLVGGAADAASWWGMAKLDALGMLAPGSGPGTCQPFGADRDGTVPGDGAAFLLLERWDSAVARGATIYAEAAGEASTQQSPSTVSDGRAISRAVAGALKAAGCSAAEVAFAVTSASGSPAGDAAEARGLSRVLGSDVPVTSVVGSTGHLMAGAGALNAAVAVLSLHHGELPPVAGDGQADQALDLAVVRGLPKPVAADVGLATACGLFGQSVALVFRRPKGEQ